MEPSNFSDSTTAVLGLDIGSVSAAMVVVDAERNVLAECYEFHRGDIPAALSRMLETIDTDRIAAVAATDRSPEIVDADFRVDDRVAVIAAAGHFHEKFGSVLHVGGETFAMLFFDETGEYKGLKTNTSCAAGTGSFLDQQAGRLKLSGIGELAEIAAQNRGELPKIASRCAVFAKTDLIHAQQEGYSLAEICDGLCFGLAKNIANTVFKHEKPNSPVIFCGGVARNRAVVEHIGEMIGERPLVDDMAHLYGAFGAASRLIDEMASTDDADTGLAGGRRLDERPLLRREETAREYGHPPLALTRSGYPDFDDHEAWRFTTRWGGTGNQVEVDLYEPLPGAIERYPVYVGIDIGSTSTKAVWVTPEKRVAAGFYTRTAGRPVEAMCSLLEAMDDLAAKRSISLDILGAATTGSGRKFVGALAGADLVVDEITAHARAAVELNPDVDTIIEIGGQDAKFTTLRNGRVTFSIMNTVCAAGTGSFIEEQAEKLGVPLFEYAARTLGVAAPIASDRCTVFMERDINYYLGRGYRVDEVLAAALHAVRENYLNKVAVQSAIGNVVCFQGATAKNPSLVAAFEQGLGRTIHVSSYCHLTGALGVALHLADDPPAESRFRDLGLYRQEIPIRSEVCELCTNHCKITVADMPDGPVAYGFLCGRDYGTRKFVDNNTAGFDLIRARNRIFPVKNRVKPEDGQQVTVGIPPALYLHEDMSMWVDFFNRLGIRIIAPERDFDAVKAGKAYAGAEFCAPITALHGHVAHLAERADFVFLPYYLDNREKDAEARRQYCYYSQYAPTLAAGLGEAVAQKLIFPVVRYLYSGFYMRLEIYRALRKIDPSLNFIEIVRAFEAARSAHQERLTKWRELFRQENGDNPVETTGQADNAKGETSPGRDDVRVLLLGRPYTVLEPAMNKKIPGLFASMGIKAFFQDMTDLDKKQHPFIEPFLNELHWNYAADVMAAAEYAARTPGLYPVLLTSFNCSPDSFIRDVFQELMEGADKPYLILEMDEHGSSVGYETRIEAAIRSFRNHAAAGAAVRPDAARINPVKTKTLSGKTVLFPNWDPITCRLLVANLRREGLDVRLITENEGVIRRSMRLNSGQCIPINVIAQEFVEYVRENDIDPADAVLWMAYAEIACNIRLYPYKLRQMISSFGGGMDRAGVYPGAIGFTDISIRAAMNSYFAYMFGGMIRRMGCRVRPYEKNPGETNRVIESSVAILEEAFAGTRDKESAVADVVGRFESIRTVPGRRPEVALFGDLYVRDNPVFNQDLIAYIEARGGEALTTPYTDYVKMIAQSYFRKWFTEGKYFNLMVNRAMFATMTHQERAYWKLFQRVLGEPEPVYDDDPAEILAGFGVIPENTGESMDNLLKIHYIKKFHPNVALFVQASPSFCCPSMVSEAMAGIIESRTGVPVVPITYDATGGDKNRKIIPYLAFAAARTDERQRVAPKVRMDT